MAGVLKVESAPYVVPAALTATTRKWYSVFGTRPFRYALTSIGLPPSMGLGVASMESPYAVVVPYSNITAVLALFGFTLPLSLAVVSVTLSAARVIAVAPARVRNVV